MTPEAKRLLTPLLILSARGEPVPLEEAFELALALAGRASPGLRVVARREAAGLAPEARRRPHPSNLTRVSGSVSDARVSFRYPRGV